MSERVQLLLSDRILGMTLTPEGRVWNYGVGLAQMWTANLPYHIVLDTPLPFWAEQHRPNAFLSVSFVHTTNDSAFTDISARSLQTWRRVTTLLTWKTALHRCPQIL
jgi:pre-mRNA-processing factor 8